MVQMLLLACSSAMNEWIFLTRSSIRDPARGVIAAEQYRRRLGHRAFLCG